MEQLALDLHAVLCSFVSFLSNFLKKSFFLFLFGVYPRFQKPRFSLVLVLSLCSHKEILAVVSIILLSSYH